MSEQSSWLELLNDQIPEVGIEKQNLEISKICERARELRKRLDDSRTGESADHDAEVLELVQEMHALDRTAAKWRGGQSWTFRVLPSPFHDRSVAPTEQIHVYPDLWIAYEWNYHRTARIILHEHLLESLSSLSTFPQTSYPSNWSSTPTIEETTTLFNSSKHVINTLIEEIFSTVPQLLGDVDALGNLPMEADAEWERGKKGSKSIGAYFLLWSIKVIKSTGSATDLQRQRAGAVLERIRLIGGMFDIDLGREEVN